MQILHVMKCFVGLKDLSVSKSQFCKKYVNFSDYLSILYKLATVKLSFSNAYMFSHFIKRVVNKIQHIQLLTHWFDASTMK